MLLYSCLHVWVFAVLVTGPVALSAKRAGSVLEAEATGLLQLPGQDRIAQKVPAWRQKVVPAHHEELSTLDGGLRLFSKTVVIDVPHAAAYDRKVSVPITCVMILTMLCVTMYVCLAFARNIDELAGRQAHDPSLATQTLTVAARSISYPPVICCLFVASSMHVLASTEGLKEVQGWVQVSMIAATTGMAMQFVLVLSLPFLTCAHKELSFTEVVGGIYDVHPRIARLINFGLFYDERVGYCVRTIQFFALCSIYGGTISTLIGMYLFSSGPTQKLPSPAFRCTSVLVATFALVRSLVWSQPTRTRQGVSHGVVMATCGQRSVLAAAFAVQKVPMLCLLFLVARLWAMQLNPWDGLPQLWARHNFYVTTSAVVLEAIVAAIIGAVGEEEIGYYGAFIYKGPVVLHLFQYAFAAIAMFGVYVACAAVWTMHAHKGPTPSIPPSIHCAMVLSIFYAWVHGGLYSIFFLKHIFGWHWKVAQDAMLAANTSVSFCPMLAVLFVAARIRASQITDFKGAPQCWVQDCMVVCVMASLIQAGCCIALPLISGNKSGFDDEGNATYDLGPMAGAYIVTVIKYFLLAALIGCMLLICLGILLLTPATANYHGPDDLFAFVAKMGWLALILLCAMALSSAKVVGQVIKVVVERVPGLGAELKVEHAALSIFNGYVNLAGVSLQNPRGYNFKSKNVLTVDIAVIQFDVWQAIRSRFRQLVIDVVALKGVHLNMERGPQANNVSVLLSMLKSEEDANSWKARVRGACSSVSEKKPTCLSMQSLPFRRPWSSRNQSDGPVKTPVTEEQECDDEGAKVILHKLDVRQVGATLMVGSLTTAVALGDIKIDNFAEEKVKASEITRIVLSTLLKSALSNTELLKSAFRPCCPSLIGEATIPTEAAPVIHIGHAS